MLKAHLWRRDNNPSLATIEFRNNWYDDYAYYFISMDGLRGKRIVNNTINSTATRIFDQFDNYVFHEKDSLNINEMGREWVGEMLNGKQNFSKTFQVQSTVPNTTAYFNYSIVGKNAENTQVSLALNSQAIENFNFNRITYNNFNIQQKSLPFTMPSSVSDLVVKAEYANASNPAGLAFINYFQLRFKSYLNYQNQQFNFRTLDPLTLGETIGFKFSQTGNYKVWNVSDIHNAFQVSPDGLIYKTHHTNSSFPNELVAFSEANTFISAEYVERVDNQNIRGYKNIDYVIFTHPLFLDQANRLADFRRRHDKIQVAVVTTKQVYNEFSSGGQDPFAFRDYLRYLRSQGSSVQFALLLGGVRTIIKIGLKTIPILFPHLLVSLPT